MGNVFFKPTPAIVMFGLDGTGKSSILYTLQLGKFTSKVQTIGFNVEKICVEGVEYSLWDIGGHDKMIPFWKHHGDRKSFIIYVVDSSHREQLAPAAAAFHQIINEREFTEQPILILANKQDLEGVMSTAEIEEGLELSRLPSDRPVKLLPCSAKLQQGLEEGIKWFNDGTPLPTREIAFKTAKSARSVS